MSNLPAAVRMMAGRPQQQQGGSAAKRPAVAVEDIWSCSEIGRFARDTHRYPEAILKSSNMASEIRSNWRFNLFNVNIDEHRRGYTSDVHIMGDSQV